MPLDTNTIAVPLGTRLLRIVRVQDGWQLWTGTRDYVHGSYLLLNDEGDVHNVTVRKGQGDDSFQVRHKDKELW